MIDLIVSSGNVSRDVNVIIPNAKTFGPEQALAAVRIAGCGTPATVTDHTRYYRVTGKSGKYRARLMKYEDTLL